MYMEHGKNSQRTTQYVNGDSNTTCTELLQEKTPPKQNRAEQEQNSLTPLNKQLTTWVVLFCQTEKVYLLSFKKKQHLSSLTYHEHATTSFTYKSFHIFILHLHIIVFSVRKKPFWWRRQTFVQMEEKTFSFTFHPPPTFL